MTKEEFTDLPPVVALGVLYDIAASKLAAIPKPDYPKPPRYDGRLSRKGGFVWMSELNSESLRYWHGKKVEGASSGSQWAEKDAKIARSLEAWIAWRAICPNEIWSGTRGDDRATAAPPSREPALHQWDNSKRAGGGSRSGGNQPPPDEEEIDESSIPF